MRVLGLEENRGEKIWRRNSSNLQRKIGKKMFNMTRMKSFIEFTEREQATEIKGQSATVNRDLSP